jgi:hypothetical protein
MLAVLAVLALPATASALPPRVTPSERAAINATLDQFVNHAVKRKGVAASFSTVTGDLRAGLTRKQWATGSIPVYPYPASGKTFHEWTIRYRTKDEIGLELILRPTTHGELGPILFHVYLSPMRDGRWLVNSFMPGATFAPDGAKPKVVAMNDFLPQAQGDGKPGGSGRVNELFAFVPFAVIGLLFASLVGWGVFSHYRDRRFARTSRKGLPPLTMRGDGPRARPDNGP